MLVSTEFSKLVRVDFVKIPACLWMPVSAVWAKADLTNMLLPAKFPKTYRNQTRNTNRELIPLLASFSTLKYNF